MANYAQIKIGAKCNLGTGKIDSGVTIKFNVFVGGIQYRSFISSTQAGLGYFETLTELGMNIVALNPAYSYSVESNVVSNQRTDILTLTVDQYDLKYNFGTFYSSNTDKIYQESKLDNVDPELSGLNIINFIISHEMDGDGSGAVSILATITPSGSKIEYSIDDVDYQTSNTFTGLSAGSYTAYVRAASALGYTDSEPFVIENNISPLYAFFTKKDVSSSGGADGEIDVTVNQGSESYNYLWNDGITTKDRTGLSGGDYSVEITDTITGSTFNLYVTIYEPDALEKPAPYFYVPDLVSLRYAKEETKDFDRVFPTPENTLFKDSNYPGVSKAGYCQKVSRADTITIQLQSNYDNNTLTLNNESGEVLRVPFEKKLTLTGIQEEYTGFATLAGIGISSIGSTETTYIYPNADTFVSGNVVVISDSVDLNGTYTILSRGFNPNIGQEYVEINKPLLDDETVTPDLSVTVTFINDLRPYDIYEAVINFGIFPAGHYTSVIEASDSRGTQRLVSEPIKLLNSNDAFWEKTSLIEYQNEDNAFNIAYSTEIVNRIRIESRMFKLSPGGDSEVLRQPNGDIVKISGKAYRGMTLETYKIPNYLHEKLIAIFQHDYILINKQQVQTDENYEVDYADFSPYANGTIDLEVLGWFDKGNGHDPGNGMTGTGFIIVNEGFLLR